jgi:hypothetical protein
MKERTQWADGWAPPSGEAADPYTGSPGSTGSGCRGRSCGSRGSCVRPWRGGCGLNEELGRAWARGLPMSGAAVLVKNVVTGKTRVGLRSWRGCRGYVVTSFRPANVTDSSRPDALHGAPARGQGAWPPSLRRRAWSAVATRPVARRARRPVPAPRLVVVAQQERGRLALFGQVHCHVCAPAGSPGPVRMGRQPGLVDAPGESPRKATGVWLALARRC